MQAFPSLHGAPSVFAGFEHCPVEGSHVPATWHWSLALHTMEGPLLQTPARHLSDCVQPLASLHDVPSAAGGFVHCPVVVLQTPATWQASEALQTTGLAPTHAPAEHESTLVQAFPSSHGAPSAFAGLVHAPVSGLQKPATWQESAALHTTGFAPTQVPWLHVSVCVQGFWSSQVEPSASGGFVHAPVIVLQVPAA